MSTASAPTVERLAAPTARRADSFAPPYREFEWRLSRLRSALDDDELDAVLVYGWPWRSENVRYLTGARTTGGASLVLVTRDDEVRALASDVRDAVAIRRAGWIHEVDDGLRAGSNRVQQLLRGTGPRIGVSQIEFMPTALLGAVREAAGGAELVPASSLFDRLRLVKSPWEHSCVRDAVRIAVDGWSSLMAELRPGLKEYEAVAIVERELKRAGAEDNFMLIAFGNSEVRGMHPPENRPLASNEFVRTELTPQFDGYYAQICRTGFLGDPTDEQFQAYDAFIAALEAGIATVRAGVTAGEVAVAENNVLRARGLGEYTKSKYMRVRGHGVGIHVDEIPAIREGEGLEIPSGATFVVHPNTYNPVGYIVVGDEVIVTDSGSERLSTAESVLPSKVV